MVVVVKAKYKWFSVFVYLYYSLQTVLQQAFDILNNINVIARMTSSSAHFLLTSGTICDTSCEPFADKQKTVFEEI
jgi:hypothetical protein